MGRGGIPHASQHSANARLVVIGELVTAVIARLHVPVVVFEGRDAALQDVFASPINSFAEGNFNCSGCSSGIFN